MYSRNSCLLTSRLSLEDVPVMSTFEYELRFSTEQKGVRVSGRGSERLRVMESLLSENNPIDANSSVVK